MLPACMSNNGVTKSLGRNGWTCWGFTLTMTRKSAVLACQDFLLASVIQLIANPNAYDGKRVRTSGYVHFQFEGNAVYLHKEDFIHDLYSNGLYLNADESIRAACQDRYASLEGLFSAKDRGHMSLWSGMIRVQRCTELN